MPHPNGKYRVRYPGSTTGAVLDPAINYEDDDVLVETYPWAFGPKRSLPPSDVERATAEPGEKRRRTRKTSERPAGGWSKDPAQEG